jgi:predicted enzyme related to lactoylglutathione lyase
MTPALTNPVVLLELHTDNLPSACAFYAQLFGWSAETVRIGCRSYVALDLGVGIDGGVVERQVERPVWLPYVEVTDVAETTERARRRGASVTLEPREGPAGWRSALAAPSAAEIALWQAKA